MTDHQVPKPPHVVRATLVATMSDGSRASFVVEGDERTDLELATESEYWERRSAAFLLGEHVPTGYCDLTFKLAKVTGYTLYDQPAGSATPEQPAIEQAPDAVGTGRDVSDSSPAQ